MKKERQKKNMQMRYRYLENGLALLGVPHVAIDTVLLEKLVMTTTLCDLTLLQHNNLV